MSSSSSSTTKNNSVILPTHAVRHVQETNISSTFGDVTVNNGSVNTVERKRKRIVYDSDEDERVVAMSNTEEVASKKSSTPSSTS